MFLAQESFNLTVIVCILTYKHDGPEMDINELGSFMGWITLDRIFWQLSWVALGSVALWWVG